MPVDLSHDCASVQENDMIIRAIKKIIDLRGMAGRPTILADPKGMALLHSHNPTCE